MEGEDVRLRLRGIRRRSGKNGDPTRGRAQVEVRMFRNVLVVGLGLGLGVAHAGVSVRPAWSTATVKAGGGVGIIISNEGGPRIRQILPLIQPGPKLSGR